MAKTTSRLDKIDQQTQELAQSIKESISELALQVNDLNERYKRITGQDFVNIDLPGEGVRMNRRPGRPKGSTNGTATAPKGGKKRRARRTTEQLHEQAGEILAFIKKAGSEGVKGSAIRKEFGQILPSVREFVKLYGDGKTLKTKGQKAAMTYHYAD